MALTPEQVINKTFQPTKFREGYDQEEVDLFLDEVVAELRRLHAENDDLRQQLGEAGISSPAIGAEDDVVVTDPMPSTGETVEADEADAVAGDAPVERESDALPPLGEPAEERHAPESAAAPTSSSESAAAVIAMAQRLHDEYVAQGEAERQRLIDEGQAAADTLVTDAETRRDNVLSSLEESKAGLESDVESLRGFEAAYRSGLRSYLQDRLEDLESGPSLEPAS